MLELLAGRESMGKGKSARPKTFGSRGLKKVMAIDALLYPERKYWRPRTRADCSKVPRPCPYVGCRHHLYLDVTDAGNLKLNFPDKEPEELEHSCSLDVAEEGGITLEALGELLNVTRERVRQVENCTLYRIRKFRSDSPLLAMFP